MSATLTERVSLNQLTWEQYIRFEIAKGVSPMTVRNYRIRFPAFQRELKKLLQEATPIDLQDFFAKLREDDYANSTIGTYGGILMGFFSWVEDMLGNNEHGHPIHPNPMKAIKLPAPEDKEMPSLTRSELESVKNYFKEREEIVYDITDLLVAYCLRGGELLPDRLDHRGRNPKKLERHIRFAKVRDRETGEEYDIVIFRVKGKGGKHPKPKRKSLPLLDRRDRRRIQRILREQMTLGTYRKRLYRAQKDLKIRLTDSNGDTVRLRPHILRHTSMTLYGAKAFRAAGGDSEAGAVLLSKISGHDSLKMLLKYTHPSASTIRDVMSGLSSHN